MLHQRSGLRHRKVARAGLLALRTTTAAVMLLGTMTIDMAGAGAQADEDEGTGESLTFGFELEWDDEIWTVEGGSSEDDVDALALSSG